MAYYKINSEYPIFRFAYEQIIMKRAKHLIFSLFCLLSMSGFAQDMHFSYYQMAPLSINPAFSGAYFGTYRVGVLYRDQWLSITPERFTTLNLYADAPIIRGIKENDWIGVGINFFRDNNAGGGPYSVQGQLISLAYHLSFGKKNPAVLTVGAQYGSTSFALTNTGFVSRFSIINGSDQELTNIFTGLQDGELKKSTSDWSGGIMLTSPLGETSDMRLGLSMSHLFTPNKAVSPGTFDDLDRRINGFAQFYFDMNEKITFNPGLLFQKMGYSSQILLQGLFSMLFNEEKEIYLNGGLGFRLNDNSDAIIYLGADIKDIRIGASYDLNVSGLSPATGSFGAFELGISYIGKIYKKPKVKPIMVCPRL